MSMLAFHVPLDEIEVRKQRIRNVWNYKKVDHIPVIISIYSNPWNYTIHEQYEDPQKQLAVALEGVKKSLQWVPDDYIPSIRPDVGCVVVSSTFGGELIYNKNMPNTTIGIKPIISNPEEIYKLKTPNPYKDGLMPAALERMRYFAKHTQGKIYLSNVDMGGPLNAACDLIESTLFYKMMLKNPEPLKYLLNMLTDLFIYYDQLLIEAAGGLENMASIDWDNTWCPEGYKGYVSDDICANIDPKSFELFSKPYNNRIYERFGAGLLHNCGPHPCVYNYLDHKPPIKGIQCHWDYSKKDLQKIADTLAGRGIAYIMIPCDDKCWDQDFKPVTTTIDDIMPIYEEIVNIFSPKAIAIPEIRIDAARYDKEEIQNLYWKLRKISEKYTEEMEQKNMLR